MLSIKSCPKCKTDGMYNRDQIFCHLHPRTKLIQMAIVEKKRLDELKDAIRQLRLAINEPLKNGETLHEKFYGIQVIIENISA